MNNDKNEEENEEENEEIEETYESEEFETLQIKNEKPNHITLDLKVYNKLISQLNNFIELSRFFQKDLKKVTTKETQTDNVINEEYEKKISSLKEIISTFKIENEVLKRNVENLTNDNNKLNSDLKQLGKKFREKTDKLNKEIYKLRADLAEVTKKNDKLTFDISHMKKVSPIEEVLNNEKNLNCILSYLPIGYNIKMASLNKALHNHFYYEKKYQLLKHHYESAKKLLDIISTKDVSKEYSIGQGYIHELIQKYTIDHKIPGNELRFRVIRSLLFIENIVREPLRNAHDEEADEKDKNMVSQFLDVISGDSNENIIDSMVNENQINTVAHVVELPKEKIDDLSTHDKEILKVVDNDTKIAVKFEFETPDSIKTLLRYFFKAKLKKDDYAKFLQYIVEEFSELLFSCYTTLKEVKELEIVNQAIDARFKKYQYLCQDMQEELNDLNKFAKSSKTIKEMLLTQRNEVEIKYNDTLIELSKLSKEKDSFKQTILDIDKERINCEKEFLDFKTKILKEYKNVEANYKLVTKERDIFKNTLIDFRNYFMQNISDQGELINK